jgi:hypothetical protein
MSTQTLDRVDTIEDLDFEPSCQRELCEAGHPVATHLAESIKCGCTRLICQPCTEYFLRLLRSHAPHRGICLACKTQLYGFPRECLRLVPIK